MTIFGIEPSESWADLLQIVQKEIYTVNVKAIVSKNCIGRIALGKPLKFVLPMGCGAV
jgi:hypothetical protein